MTTKFEEWEAERMQDPKFLAALEKQYPKSERDEAQARITVLEEENEWLRAALEAMAARSLGLQARSMRYELTIDRLRAALEAFPDWHDYGLAFECDISPGADGVIEWIAAAVKWQVALKGER